MNQTVPTDLNFNAAQCIQSANYFGHTDYTNVCSGAVHVVNWGGLDWALCLSGVGICAIVGVGLLLLLCAFVRAVFDI